MNPYWDPDVMKQRFGHGRDANTPNMLHDYVIYRTQEDILMEETACIPVAYYNDFWLQSDKITGSWHSPYGYRYFMYADIAE